MTTTRKAPLLSCPPGVGPNGRKFCRWCQTAEVPRGRQSWCSDACVDQYKLQSDSGYIRRLVKARDHGVCALCGRDCLKVKVRLDTVLRNRYDNVALYAVSIRLVRWLRRFGFKLNSDMRSVSSLWQADHIVPVCEGGGGCGLGNFRTLCTPCHKGQTRQLAARRAKDRKGLTKVHL